MLKGISAFRKPQHYKINPLTNIIEVEEEHEGSYSRKFIPANWFTPAIQLQIGLLTIPAMQFSQTEEPLICYLK